jgi:peptidoglycan L-alanyl-D-glutamate endopeptidase CwlK
MITGITKLRGVVPELRRVVELAGTRADLAVLEGLRTPEHQAELLKAGATKTLNSRHLTGHAVDLAPIVDGRVRWDWPLYFKLAALMQACSQELATPIRWGGCWSSLATTKTPERLQAEYVQACRNSKRRPFLDGPHFEIPRGAA